MKVVLFGFFTVRPAWTETAGNVSVRACLREAGETGFLLHGAGRIVLAFLCEEIIIGTQQQHTTFRFPDNVLHAQRLEKSKDFGLYFSADFCPGWGHQALSITHSVRESHGTADEFALSGEVASTSRAGCLMAWWLGNMHRRYWFGHLQQYFKLSLPLSCQCSNHWGVRFKKKGD